MNECENCKIEFEGRKDARFCSPKCRVTFSRKQSIVTDNVTVKAPDVTDNFEWYYITKANGAGRLEDEESDHKMARYWYEVPLAAVPVMREGWPPKPEYMSGRQYFLWWKNEFRLNNDPKVPHRHGEPVIHNPFKEVI